MSAESIPERKILEDVLVAPCKPGGEVITLDEETREGCCDCKTNHCLVDRNNVVVQKSPANIIIEETKLQPTV